jgi:hypothetical protein
VRSRQSSEEWSETTLISDEIQSFSTTFFGGRSASKPTGISRPDVDDSGACRTGRPAPVTDRPRRAARLIRKWSETTRFRPKSMSFVTTLFPQAGGVTERRPQIRSDANDLGLAYADSRRECSCTWSPATSELGAVVSWFVRAESADAHAC